MVVGNTGCVHAVPAHNMVGNMVGNLVGRLSRGACVRYVLRMMTMARATARTEWEEEE